ncbi:MAG TPA: SDR family oxidoreductase [Acidimicrobiales bacterium]|nr:SDR family oxidoreductase [Acidimicrobiales bacterium]
MGKLDGKVAVITGGSTGMALAGAKLFVDEGAYVFITGRRQDVLDEAVKQIGRNVTGVQGDASDLDDLDRLYDTVKREKGSIDVLWASAGVGEPAPLGEITEAWLNELRDRRIRVNVLTPGQVATAKQEELFDEATKRQFESLIPRGKMGHPDEIATAALFLASDDSSYVNGMELVADGGTTGI